MTNFSRHITIAVVTPSDLVLSGLTSALSRLGGLNATILHVQPGDIVALVNERKVSAIIVDAICAPWSTMEHLHLENEQSSTSFILFIATQLPAELTRNYDAVISLYDSQEVIRKTVTTAIRSTRENDSSNVLTPRERQIVISVAKGMSNKEVAAEMGLSVNTVMTHRRNIAAKLHIHSPAGLTIYALAGKLISIDDLKSIPN